jgi:L-lactate permease
MAGLFDTTVGFLAALIVSTLVIFIVTKLTGEKEGLVTALIAAIVGTVIYTLVYWILGNGLLAALVAGFVWLLALKALYKIGWLKALLIAIVVWILAAIVGFILPTLTGPF